MGPECSTVTLTEDGNGALTNNTEDAVAGVASFTVDDDLIYTNVADDETFTLTANGGALTAAVSGQLVASDVLATKLVISGVSGTGDNAVEFGSNITLTVSAVNAAGTLDNDDVSTFSVAVTDDTDDALTEISFNSGTLIAGTKQLTTMSLTADDLTATTVDGAGLKLIASDTGVGSSLTTSVADTTLTINFVASKLLVTQQPSGAVDEVALTTQPKVSAVDASNNVDTANSSEVITASTATSGAAVGGTTTATMSSGVATFSGLKANVNGTFSDGSAVTLSFNDDDDFATLGNFAAVEATPTVLDVVSTILFWVNNPATCVSGFACGSQSVIQARDAHSNVDTGKAATITISVNSGGGALVGTSTQAMASGSLTTSGIGYTATADQEAFTLAANGGSLTEGTSGSVTADVVATKFLVVPATTTPTAGVANTLTVTAADANNTTDAGYNPVGKAYTFKDSLTANLSTHTSPGSNSPTIPSDATVIAAFGADGVAPLATFTLVKAENLGTITVSDGTLSGTSAGVVIKHAAAGSFTVTPSSTTPDTNTTLNAVVTAKDAFGNLADGTNSGTPFTGIVFLTTNATSPVWYNQVGNITASGTKTFSNAVKFPTAEGSVTITAENNGATVSGTSATITVSSPTAPTVTLQSPLDNATSTAITVSPTVTFSEAMDADTINPTTVQLRAYDGDAVVNSVVTYSGGVATIDPVASLSNNTQYYIWVSGAKNAAGTTVTAYTTKASQEFTTVALGNGSLAVTSITTTKSYATADASYTNGWSWTFNITVPTTETNFKMKFDDWMSGTSTIAVANNMRFYSAQAATAVDADNDIDITASGTYSAIMTLSGDLDATTAGRQIQVVVDAKVPVGSTGGSYSTAYGVFSN